MINIEGGQDLEIIAGHCSVNRERLGELYEMSEIMVFDRCGGMQRALSAVRFVGLKSRTEYNLTGSGMGIDFPVIEQAIIHGVTDEIPPSVLLAQQFVKETDLGIATEVMMPEIQLPFYERRIPKGKLLAWNPSTNQLGWQVRQMAEVAGRNNWTVGLKNGKWFEMEKTWLGLATYANNSKCHIIFIHRGVDIPEKGDFRNAPVHEVVKRLVIKVPRAGRYFDPSHCLGPKLKDEIVKETVEAMKMTVGNEYLYTGLLIEAGTSKTDTNQHISINELKILLNEISKFRRLKGPMI